MNTLNRILPWRRKKTQTVITAMFPPKYIVRGIGPGGMIVIMAISMAMGGFFGWTFCEIAITMACDSRKEFAPRSYLLEPIKYWCQHPNV
jgi:hypothetical protein